MEQLSANLAKKISISLGYSDEKEQVIRYGLTAMLQFVSILLIITIVGLFGNFIYESIIIFFGVGILRKSTGGAHSGTMVGCMIVSCLNITILAFISKYVSLLNITPFCYLMFYLCAFLACMYIVYKYAPMDSPNKPITSEKKIMRLRKQSFSKVIVYSISAIVFALLSNKVTRLQSIANSIVLLTLWQCFTVTPGGAKLLHKMDRYFSKSN